ncbi:MAG: major capsid protein [Microviridae sp.]|nr:MAG: major capsid protein [Microviridae sp.]
MEVTLGGDRLGSGKKMKVDLHTYNRSTHDLGYLFRTTMAAGTLVPFLVELMTPGDTFDIDLDAIIMTHPTIGPLFGSYKVQLDVFSAPIRLYQGKLHNNQVNLGLKMSDVKIPQMTLFANQIGADVVDLDNCQVNPSALLKYLGISGVGAPIGDDTYQRDFNALPLLMYFDIYKNYYANKQEEEGAIIYTVPAAVESNVSSVEVNSIDIDSTPSPITGPVEIQVTWTGGSLNQANLIFITDIGEFPLSQIGYPTSDVNFSPTTFTWKWWLTGNLTVTGRRYRTPDELPNTGIQVERFPLSTVDDMKKALLAHATEADAFNVNDAGNVIGAGNPYSKVLNWVDNASPYMPTQNGLAIKTYQNDLFNNWLNTEWIDGNDGINEITRVVITGGSFGMDELALSKKVWEMLNRIAVSGGSYYDWIGAVYTGVRIDRSESPIYHGSLIKELIFQEVISNSESTGENGGVQPLGTLAGRGKLSGKHKGGRITVKTDEPAYLMGLISLTPRIDYSQGNHKHSQLLTLDDIHKPQLDQIGFQDLIEERMAWWSTTKTGTAPWTQLTAGKQPAWIDYMTNVNKTFGNFAIADNEMFMTLNRRYERDGALGILDMTTYIDPEKYNHIFAETQLDAQNFWTQISVDMTARRMLSAKVMPML